MVCQYIDKEPQKKSGDAHALFHSGDFFQKLKEWKQTLEHDYQRATSIREKFTTFNPPQDSNALLVFTLSLLDDPRGLLHQRMSSLLIYLDLDHLEETLVYLASLADAPWPKILRQGDYLAIQPVNENHAKCIKLLNNNCAVFNIHNVYCDHANSILQAILMIFEDLRLDSMLLLDSVNDELEFSDEASKSSCHCWLF